MDRKATRNESAWVWGVGPILLGWALAPRFQWITVSLSYDGRPAPSGAPTSVVRTWDATVASIGSSAAASASARAESGQVPKFLAARSGCRHHRVGPAGRDEDGWLLTGRYRRAQEF
jgi:hypothetical protein